MIKSVSFSEFAGPIHAKVIDTQVQSDWECEDSTNSKYIQNKPNVVLTINGKSANGGEVSIAASDVVGMKEMIKNNTPNMSDEDIEKLFKEIK